MGECPPVKNITIVKNVVKNEYVAPLKTESLDAFKERNEVSEIGIQKSKRTGNLFFVYDGGMGAVSSKLDLQKIKTAKNLGVITVTSNKTGEPMPILCELPTPLLTL